MFVISTSGKVNSQNYNKLLEASFHILTFNFGMSEYLNKGILIIYYKRNIKCMTLVEDGFLIIVGMTS